MGNEMFTSSERSLMAEATPAPVNDHQDIFELQNYSTATAGKHTIRFVTRLRAYRDARSAINDTRGPNQHLRLDFHQRLI
jgi:hypothetical protein